MLTRWTHFPANSPYLLCIKEEPRDNNPREGGVRHRGDVGFGLPAVTLELDASHDRALPRQAESGAVVDEAETARGLAGRRTRLRGQRVGRRRVARFGAVEDVGELAAQGEVHALLDAERAAEVDVLGGTA